MTIKTEAYFITLISVILLAISRIIKMIFKNIQTNSMIIFQLWKLLLGLVIIAVITGFICPIIRANKLSIAIYVMLFLSIVIIFEHFTQLIITIKHVQPYVQLLTNKKVIIRGELALLDLNSRKPSGKMIINVKDEDYISLINRIKNRGVYFEGGTGKNSPANIVIDIRSRNLIEGPITVISWTLNGDFVVSNI